MSVQALRPQLAVEGLDEAGGNGHGNGHNLLGSGSMMAAATVKEDLSRNILKGRVRYYGCPAEERGSFKGFMVRAGMFDDIGISVVA